jgi:flagellar biogenesis protein FliO
MIILVFGARAFVVVLFGEVVVLFGVLRFVLAMVGVVARVVRLRRQNQKNCRQLNTQWQQHHP